jgi:O-methyltransferase
MKKNLLKIASKITPKQFKPVLRPLKNKLFPQIKPIILFEGWGMTTEHEIPWINDLEFQKTNQMMKQSFIHDGVVNTSEINTDSLLWRHWNVTFCIRYVLRFAKSSNLNFVECGVASGMSAYFALTELKDKSYNLHLYDSWGIMKSEYLYDSEKENIGKYEEQKIQNTRKNLDSFSDKIKYHVGYIPETFNDSAPNEISYLHIDVNSAKTTMEILEFFYPTLTSNGIILFDDYGWSAYNETRKQVDKFLLHKDGVLFISPTGQAIFYKS